MAPLISIPIGFRVCTLHNAPVEALSAFARAMAQLVSSDPPTSVKPAYAALVAAMIEDPPQPAIISAWLSPALCLLIIEEWKRQLYEATDRGQIGGRA